MPYYFGEGEPGWDEYLERQEAENLAHGPLDRFTYLEPWEAKASVLQFSRTPRTASESRAPTDESPVRRPSIMTRLFGSQAPQASKTPQESKRVAEIEIGSPERMENYHAAQKRKAEEALERVAVWAAAFRAAGVRRVLMRYDGGNDEGFTHFEALEMADGRRLTRQDPTARDVVRAAIEATGDKVYLDGFDKHGYLEILDDAAVAFLGPGFGTGSYEMFGAITIDCEGCTITDEQDPSRTFPEDAKGA
jgi:hypothetical protein